MTEHEHAAVSRKLALAIGWNFDDVRTVSDLYGSQAYCEVWPWGVDGGGSWKMFDYRDPSVIWAVAERFNCFPSMIAVPQKWCSVSSDAGFYLCYADTAALAVARAVIAAKEKA